MSWYHDFFNSDEVGELLRGEMQPIKDLMNGENNKKIIEFFVEGDPVPKQSFRARNGGGGYTSPHVRAWANLVSDVATIEMVGKEMLTNSVSVELTFYLPTKRRKDWDNLAKNVMDAMNGIVYRDDSQVTTATIIKMYDKNNPGVFVMVRECYMEAS